MKEVYAHHYLVNLCSCGNAHFFPQKDRSHYFGDYPDIFDHHWSELALNLVFARQYYFSWLDWLGSGIAFCAAFAGAFL